MRMLSKDDEPDDSTEVTWEDQQKISTFSKLNGRRLASEQKLNQLKSDKEALDDLSSELELADEDDLVAYRIGQSFFHISLSQAQGRLENDQAELDKELEHVGDVINDCEKSMNELKAALYARFGSSINLEA